MAHKIIRVSPGKQTSTPTGDIILKDRFTIILQLCGNLIDLLPDAENVPAGDLGRVFVTHPLSQQLGNEIGVFRHILQPLRHRRNPIKVGAKADVVEANQIANVKNMPDDLVERGVCGEVLGKTVLIARLNTRDEVGGKVDHDEGITLLDQLEHIVLDVSRVRADAEGGAVGVDDGGLAALPVLTPEDVDLGLLAGIGLASDRSHLDKHDL